TILAPRQVRLGRMPAPGGSVVFSASRSPSDGGAASGRHTWKFGEGRAVARLNAPALELYLGLWGRRPLAAHAIVHGDATAVDRLLAEHLVP
ncbi:MAG TPA: maleylpyruvate isomerase family mycothiol-dependent enzyme, partial [Micrococcaceae bacterium]|nr:maleylpyruvate isomerase family mycothiol-dependent enzyme [Micrococcaceae bacterium]